MHVINGYVLNEMPNCNAAMHIANVRLTTYNGHKTFLKGDCVYSHHAEGIKVAS